MAIKETPDDIRKGASLADEDAGEEEGELVFLNELEEGEGELVFLDELPAEAPIAGIATCFISHSTKDAGEKAVALARSLEDAGKKCWIAPRDVKAGVPYPGQIVAAIENASLVVVLVTPGANDSGDMLQEVQIAHTARKVIVPIVVDRTTPSPDLRYYVGVRHQIAWSSAADVVKTLLA
jgi:hypothetical protein